MWGHNYKVVKVCFSNSRPVLLNNKMLKYKTLVYHTKCSFLYDIKFPRTFLIKSEKVEFTKIFFEVVRKNHVESRIPKIVYKPVTESRRKEISHRKLVGSLQNCRSVKEQIELFHSIVKLPDDNINSRKRICQDLEKALQPYFLSRVSVCVVGSSVNGLGFRGCDVDLSLQFSEPNMKKHPRLEELFSADEIEKPQGPISKVYAAKHQLLTVRKILQELQFEEPLTVIPGRCPILNFSHNSFPCDLAINNRLALNSTNLMLLCGQLDERVTPLMRVIIYWAKHCKLVGGPGRFKTYAIFLLVVYFLQTRKPPILPSVETMFHKTEFMENLENWSYDVTKYLKCFERSQNCQTVEELLREFFTFYGNYDFDHIICPLSGNSSARKDFSAKIDCKNSFELSSICIQDPLNLAWNVTTGVSWNHCKNFIKTIIAMWEEFQDPTCWNPRSEGKWGVLMIVDHHYVPDNLMNVREFTINFPFTLLAAENVRYILSHCLDFECYTSFEHLPCSVRGMVENQLLRTSLEDSGILARWMFATKDTWLGRNTYLLSSNCSDIDSERAISEQLKAKRGNREKESFYFLLECLKVDGCLRVKFQVLNSDMFIPKLVIFLKDYIPRLMDKL